MCCIGALVVQTSTKTIQNAPTHFQHILNFQTFSKLSQRCFQPPPTFSHFTAWLHSCGQVADSLETASSFKKRMSKMPRNRTQHQVHLLILSIDARPTTCPFGGSPGYSSEDELKSTIGCPYCAATVWGIAREVSLLDVLVPSTE